MQTSTCVCVCVCVTAHVNALKLIEGLDAYNYIMYRIIPNLSVSTFFFLVWYRCLRETEKVSVSVMAKLLKFKALEIYLIYSP